MDQVIYYIKTTVNKVEHMTKLTLDWSGCSEAGRKKYADEKAIIKYQDRHRVKGIVPPKEATYQVPEPGSRVGVDIAAVQRAARVQAFVSLGIPPAQAEELADKAGTPEGTALFTSLVQAASQTASEWIDRSEDEGKTE
jgi:hypothetical protein